MGKTKKRDIRQIESIAKEFGFSDSRRFEFGDFIEKEKSSGRKGSLNDRGDFTYAELKLKAHDFLEQIKRRKKS